ncbi:hypothetical protein CLV29_3214 [Naumannella halotolerans]|uniref:Uncharacterized protein n=1 Tax=Naumannella halotolerans TaxID=993414 RepID=A0A4R7IYI0_9ACTN|nr:hypothetical protein CLV29_3214 [Naumannella halotolerans]
MLNLLITAAAVFGVVLIAAMAIVPPLVQHR